MTTPEQTEPTPTETYMAWLTRVQLPLDGNREEPLEPQVWRMSDMTDYAPRMESHSRY